MPISWLDVILIAIMLISGFLAMVRGFTREVLSIFSWAVAAVAALYLTPKYANLLEPYVGNPSIAQIAFAAGVFILTDRGEPDHLPYFRQRARQPGRR
jgi:membrane protein required for colicin V production